MKKIIAAYFAFFVMQGLNAQEFDYGWHQTVLTNATYPTAEYLRTIIKGDTLYIIAKTAGKDSVEVDPSATVEWLHSEAGVNSNLIFITKYHVSDGSYIGSFKLMEYPTPTTSGIYIYDFEIDQNGRFIVTGNTRTGVDFDPSITNVGWYGASGGSFVAFYNADGSYDAHLEYETETIGWDLISTFSIFDLLVDGNNNLYVIGSTYGSVDLDFTIDSDIQTSSEAFDCAVVKINMNTETYEWGRLFGGPGDNFAYYGAVANEKIYIAGTFPLSTIDLDPSAATANFPAPAAHDCSFINSLDVDGNYVNGIVLGSEYFYGFTSSEEGDIFFLPELIMGESIDMDPGAGTFNVNIDNVNPLAIAKYNENLGFEWAKSLSASGSGHDILTIAATNSYVSVSGNNYDEFYIGGETITDTITQPENGEFFILSLTNGTGDFFDYQSYQYSPECGVYATNQIVSLDNELITVGYFTNELDFNLFDGETILDTTEYLGFYYTYYPFILKLDFLGFAGVEEANALSNVQAYPNPTTGPIMLNMSSGIREIQITDLSGKLLSTQIYPGTNSTTLDLSAFESGIYFLYITDNANTTSKTKIIKN